MSDSPEEFEEFRFSDQLDLVDSHDIGLYLMGLRVLPYFEVDIRKLYEYLNNLYELLDSRDFESRIETEVEQARDSIYRRMYNGEELDEDEQEELVKLVQKWQQEIRTDLDVETRIPIKNEGFFDVEKAIEHPEKLFDPEIWESMPGRTKKDIRESCRSLGVNCPTGSVFLSLRAVEDRLRFWYEEETGNQIKQEAWGKVLDKLEEHYAGNKDKPEVLSNLRFLKEKRNQVSHPDHSPTRSEAETTLIQVKGTITEIYDEVGIEEGDDGERTEIPKAEDVDGKTASIAKLAKETALGEIESDGDFELENEEEED